MHFQFQLPASLMDVPAAERAGLAAVPSQQRSLCKRQLSSIDTSVGFCNACQGRGEIYVNDNVEGRGSQFLIRQLTPCKACKRTF